MHIGEFSKEQQVTLRTIVCPEASDPHINYYLQVCASRGIDPFSNLLYLQVRSNKGKLKPGVQSTIDGARAFASRSESYAGNDEVEYDTEDGANPNWAKATVYRTVKGMRCAFTAKIRWREFKPSAPNDFQWNAKPWHMLGKAAEMQALRKAFPEALVDTSEEETGVIAEGEPVVTPIRLAAPAPLLTQWKNAIGAFAEAKVSEAQMLAKLGIKSADDLTAEKIEALRAWYDELARDEPPPPEDAA